MNKKPAERVRKLPKWMHGRKGAVGEAINNIFAAPETRTLREWNSIDDADVSPATKGRLRSNFQFPKTEQELKALEPRFNADDLPMVTYDGKIHYFTDFYGYVIFVEIWKLEGETHEQNFIFKRRRGMRESHQGSGEKGRQ